MSDEAIALIEGLRKRYGKVEAVRGLDLRLVRGRCLGLLGPNGAGKTTTIEILEGLRAPDAGRVELFGTTWAQGASRIRARIGVQLQETQLMDKLSASETLDLFGALYPRRPDRPARATAELLEVVGLSEKAEARVRELSGGQKQRLSLACALVGRPDLLFLDEPTTGLDPQARRLLWAIVEDFKRAGGTVLLTTHYMDEAEVLCDDLAIIDHGLVIARGTPDEIVTSTFEGARLLRLRVADQGASTKVLSGLRGRLEATTRGDREVEIKTAEVQAGIEALMQVCHEAGVEFADLQIHRPTLEDVFVDMTGRHIRD